MTLVAEGRLIFRADKPQRLDAITIYGQRTVCEAIPDNKRVFSLQSLIHILFDPPAPHSDVIEMADDTDHQLGETAVNIECSFCQYFSVRGNTIHCKLTHNDLKTFIG